MTELFVNFLPGVTDQEADSLKVTLIKIETSSKKPDVVRELLRPHIPVIGEKEFRRIYNYFVK